MERKSQLHNSRTCSVSEAVRDDQAAGGLNNGEERSHEVWMNCAGAVRPSQPEFSTRRGGRLEEVRQDSSLIGQLELRHDSRLKRLAKYYDKLHSNSTYTDHSAASKFTIADLSTHAQLQTIDTPDFNIYSLPQC